MRRKSKIYIPKQDDKHPCPFHMQVPPGIVCSFHRLQVCPDFFLEIIIKMLHYFVIPAMWKYFVFMYFNGRVRDEKERENAHLSRGQEFGKYHYFVNTIII